MNGCVRQKKRFVTLVCHRFMNFIGHENPPETFKHKTSQIRLHTQQIKMIATTLFLLLTVTVNSAPTNDVTLFTRALFQDCEGK